MPEIEIALSERQRHVLRHGLLLWMGPAKCSEEMAIAMGFSGVVHLFDEIVRLLPVVKAGDAMSALDWQRSLTATEIGWASSVFGAGRTWSMVTRISNEETLALLQEIRDAILPAIGHAALFGTQPRLDERGTIVRDEPR